MTDESGEPRARADEGRPPTEPTPTGDAGKLPIDRRKVLLALGFSTANLAVLRRLGLTDGESAASPAQSGILTRPRPAAGTTTPTTTTAAPFTGEPPAMADAGPAPDAGVVHERVIANGLVIDPDTGFEAVANVGIDGTAITALSLEPLQGIETIDASGLVVAPGFIDILSYSPNGYGEWAKIADGVTSNIGMHGLDRRATDWFPAHSSGRPVHYGGAYDNAYVRPTQEGLDPNDVASADQAARILASAEEDIANGFIGLHLQPEYTPGVTEAEVTSHGVLAERLGVPLCLHIRYSDNLAPGTQLEAVDEVLRIAETTGCHVHIEHINSTGGDGVMAEALSRVQGGLDRGLRLSSCTYPYTFWATYLASARFQDFQEKYGISYGDLQIAGTNQRLTEATFAQAKADNELTAAYAMTDADVDASLQADFVMVGSDAILERSHNNHPRSTGCFSRVLGHYVRERQVLDLTTALRKMTIQPARFLEMSAPAMARKGRLQRGADADITVFDPATVADRSTIADPSIRSAGIEWVLVNGTAVKSPAGVDETVLPGTAIRSATT